MKVNIFLYLLFVPSFASLGCISKSEQSVITEITRSYRDFGKLYGRVYIQRYPKTTKYRHFVIPNMSEHDDVITGNYSSEYLWPLLQRRLSTSFSPLKPTESDLYKFSTTLFNLLSDTIGIVAEKRALILLEEQPELWGTEQIDELKDLCASLDWSIINKDIWVLNFRVFRSDRMIEVWEASGTIDPFSIDVISTEIKKTEIEYTMPWN